MVSTLQELVAPVSEAEFLNLLFERRLTHFRGERGSQFADLVDWPTLIRAVESGAHPAKQLLATRYNGGIIPPLFYMEEGKPSSAKLSRLMDQGASLVFRSLDPNVPQLKLLSDSIRQSAHEQIAIAVVVTTGTGGALKVHYDVADVLVVQIEGSKHWKIYDSPVAYPVRGMRVPDPPQGGLVFDDVLQAGDTLLLPGGYWHRCENGPERSIHAGVQFKPFSAKHAVDHLVRRLLEDENFRRPLTRHRDTDELAAAEAALKSRLIDEISQLSLAKLRDLHENASASDDSY